MAEQINGYVGLDLTKLYDQDLELPEIAQNGEIGHLKNLGYLQEVLKSGKPIIAKDYLAIEGYSVIKVNGAIEQRGNGRLDILIINGDNILENIHIEFNKDSYESISALGVQLTAIV